VAAVLANAAAMLPGDGASRSSMHEPAACPHSATRKILLRSLLILAPLWPGQAWTDPDPAQSALSQGLAFDLGQGTKPDPAKAFALYCRAADLGLPAAALNVAVMLDSGRGTPRDEALAARWYAVAAAGGERRAAYNLGQLYEHGEGVPRSRDIAQAWYRRAAGEGVAAALSHLKAGARPDGSAPPGTEADAASLVFPADNTVIRQVSRPVALVWLPPKKPDHAAYFVEVAALKGGAADPHPGRAAPDVVFTGDTDVTAIDTAAALPAGHYAWRVFTIHRRAADYTGSAWVQFSVAAP
jgi:hypothetical protein